MLKNGEIVAVKVQRPGLREQITLDLYIVRNIANWLKNNIGFIRSDLVALIDELGKRVFEEMDYLNEAENAEKFRSMHIHNSKIAVPKIYRKNPKRLFKRLWQTLIPIFIYIFSVGLDKLTGKLKKESRARFRAKQLTNLLVELGPAFVKAGQVLSTRPDIIPVVLLEELSELQDQLPGFNGDKAMELIEEDLNKKINEIFLTIDKEPISAASLGQVHKAVLKNGDVVAVKVQRPGLREQITLDLYIVRNLSLIHI